MSRRRASHQGQHRQQTHEETCHLLTGTRPSCSFDVGEHDRRHPQVSNAGMTTNGLLGHLESVLQGGRRLESEAMHYLALAADDDDVARMLHRMSSPVPRRKRVHAVVRM